MFMRRRMIRNRALKSIRDLHTFVVNARIKRDILVLLPGHRLVLELFVERFNNEQSSTIEFLLELNLMGRLSGNEKLFLMILKFKGQRQTTLLLLGILNCQNFKFWNFRYFGGLW